MKLKPVTREQRALCVKALNHYANYIAESQAEFGDRTMEDFTNMCEALALAERFDKELENAEI